MAIDVLKPGLSTSVQDLGRPGYYHLGIPISGGMDRYALRVANMLVSNDEDAAVLEAVFMGPELRFEHDAMVAVTCAELAPRVDGTERKTWTSFMVRAGQVLSFATLRRGAWAYTAVAGGIDVPLVLESRSTYLLGALGALGGFEGRALKAGDQLQTLPDVRSAAEHRTVAASHRRLPAETAELRVMPGLYWHRLTETAGAGFFADTWKVAP